MTNISEQTGKVASEGIRALQGNPLCLSLVLLMIILGVATYFRNRAETTADEHIITTLLERCMEPAKR